MGYAAGFQAGSAAVTSGINTAVQFAEMLNKNEERKKKELEESKKKLKELDDKAASDWKIITDTQSSYEDKIINEQNYKKKNALKTAYKNDIEKKKSIFEAKYKDTPYNDKYTSTFVPFNDMEEETVIRKFDNEYVVPKSQYEQLIGADDSLFNNNADGTLGVYKQGENGKATEELAASFRRSQQKKVDAYDKDGNKVKVYEDQVTKESGYTFDKPEGNTEKVYINGRATKVTPAKAKELVDSGKASYDASKEDDMTSVWIGGKEKRVKRELADKMINAGIATSRDKGNKYDLFYNPNTGSWKKIYENEDIPQGFMTKEQVKDLGQDDAGVKQVKIAAGKLSAERMQMKDEDFLNEYEEGLKKYAPFGTDIDLSDKQFKELKRLEVKMQAEDPKAYITFTQADPEQKVEILLKSAQKTIERRGYLTQINPAKNDVEFVHKGTKKPIGIADMVSMTQGTGVPSIIFSLLKKYLKEDEDANK